MIYIKIFNSKGKTLSQVFVNYLLVMFCITLDLMTSRVTYTSNNCRYTHRRKVYGFGSYVNPCVDFTRSLSVCGFPSGATDSSSPTMKWINLKLSGTNIKSKCLSWQNPAEKGWWDFSVFVQQKLFTLKKKYLKNTLYRFCEQRDLWMFSLSLK